MFFPQFPYVFLITTPLTIAPRELLAHIWLYLLRNEKFAEGNSLEAYFRHEEVTDMESARVLCAFRLIYNFLLFTSFITKTKRKKNT